MQSQRIPMPKSIEEALCKRELFTKSLFSRPESLSSLMPYDGFIEEENIFQMKDGSLGAVFEVDLLEHESITEKQILRAIASTKNWFSLPENCVLQVLYEQSAYSQFDKTIQQIEDSYQEAHSVSKVLFSEKIKNLKKSCKKTDDKTPLKRRTILSIRYFPEVKTKIKASEYCKRSEALLHREMSSFVHELQTFRHILKNIESNSELNLKSFNGSDLLDFLRKFFNPATFYKREFAPYNKRTSLSDQFLFNSPKLNYSGLDREGVKTRTLTLKTSPLYAYDGGMAYFVSLDFPFKLSLNFSFPSKTNVKKFFGIKEFFLENTLSAKGKIQKEEIKEVQEKLARDDRCLQLTFNVIVEGKSDEELDERTRKICQIFHNKLECEIIEEDDIGLGLCLNSLPLNYTPDADYSTQRSIRVLRSDALKFIPIFDSFRGLKKSLSFFLSRENNIVPFSLTENETSNHSVLLSDTGSGKSAFVIECIQAAKRMSPEPIVFIIDKKSSYSMLSEYYDGELTVFDRNKKVPFSPFRGKYDEEKIAFLTKIISLAVKLTSPSYELESEHQTAITKALKLAYIKKCNRQGLSYVEGELFKQDVDGDVELSMEDFVVELGSLVDDGKNKTREVVESLISKLKPFYGDGIYAKFFSATNSDSSSSEKLFYIYDLDALDGDPVLQTLMTMSVIEEIRCIISLPSNQGRTGFLVMEEFAMLGRNNPAFRDFAIDFCETMRKKNCWLLSLTPRPQNYFELETGKAFWGTASNYIFLQMNPDSCDFIAKNSSLIDEANSEIIKSLRTKNGEYADVFYMNKEKSKQGAFRYRQTSLDRWMSPTNALDAREALNALQTHENKWEALKYLAETYPKGVPPKS
ncbi:MAG: TraC family protein [Bdellovibrionaceae bacterium]|nr:TraC family protein [Pseudobdellovibrionaceae bacterium]